MKILNLTQHNATDDQKENGLVDASNSQSIRDLLTFDDMPSIDDLKTHAESLVKIVQESGFNSVMIGGAPFFMSTLERVLKENGIRVFYAFSRRESLDKQLEDGTVTKVSVFKHLGFMEI